nr:MAG TPA: hypothetical protein [Caudoviricetes sp.]
MTKNKIYKNWAFTENEREKAESNMNAYNELKEKYKILMISKYGSEYRKPTEEELANNDIVISRRACYKHGEYIVYKRPVELTDDEIVLICDRGNLCFGYTTSQHCDYYVFED